MAETYDFIVIGAGSAGCVIAHRLVENTNASVLLIEAGGPDSRPEIHKEDLASTMSLWNLAELNWGYRTEPQTALNGRVISVARGKVWGGSSSINAMLHVRGNRFDYDYWNYLGNEGWSYEQVLPYFKKMEDFEGGSSDYRGVGGPLSVIIHADPTPVSQRLFAAATELGFDDRGEGFDYNGERQDGSVFYYQATKTREHQRASTAVAYLYAIKEKANFTLLSKAQVTRLVIEGNQVVSVEYLKDGHTVRVGVEQEVIVCGGAYESPKLLMLSGIGSAQTLQAHDIPIVVDLPGVGQNLQDHMILGVGYLSKQEHPFTATLIAETGLFTRSRSCIEQASPDLQIKFGGVKFVSPQYDKEGPAFTFAPVIIQPQSIGYVTLRSNNPLDLAVLQPNYLTSDTDIQVFLKGIELSRSLVHTSAFADFLKEELAPGAEVTDEKKLREFIRNNASTLWHPVGTCKMGRDKMAVVDPQLRVHGIERLRVADASVMPHIVAGNTNAACIMIGEKAAEMIQATYQ